MDGRVIYGDVLFLTELFCDLVSVISAGLICHGRIKPLRMFSGAAAGSLLSILAEIFIPVRWLTFALGFPISLIMALLSFGKAKPSSLLRRAALIWTSGCLFGGTVSAVYSSDLFSESKRGAFLACALAVPALYLAIRLIRANKAKRSSCLNVDINGKSISAFCLVDSGNMLSDPFSGRPVVVLSPQIAGKCFSPEEMKFFSSVCDIPPDSLGMRFSVIPTKTVNGSGILRAVRPDRVTVDGTEKDALIAVTDRTPGGFGSYDGIVPASIVEK